MEYEVTSTEQSINFAPASELEEVLQNVRTIITTPKYSVPLDREFGISAEGIDLPLPVAQAKQTAEIIAKVQRYEQRVIVTQVTYEGDALEGILRPKVRVKLRE